MLIGTFIQTQNSFTAGTGGTTSPDTAANTNASNQQIWGLIGDSKMRGTSPTTNDFGPAPYYQNTIYQYVSGVTSAINSGDINGAQSGSIAMKFGIDYYRKTGKKCCFVPKGSGGSTAQTISGNNDWSTTGSLYTPAKNEINAACANIGVTKPRGIIIDLLVNDARNLKLGTAGFSLSTITTSYASLLSRLNSDFPGVPLYIILPGREENGVTQEVLDVVAQAEIVIAAASNTYVMLREADYLTRLYGSDGLHYSKGGNIFIGAMCVKNLFTSGNIANTPITYSFNAAATTVLGRLTSPTSNEQKWINDFIGFLNDSGDLAKLDSMYCLRLGSQANATQDLLRTSKQLTLTGATYGSGGITTAGSTGSYIDSNFNPSTDGVNYTLNDSSLGFYLIANNQATSTLSSLCGVIGSAAGTTISIAQGATNGIIYRLHSSSGGTYGTGNPKADTMYTNTRLTSTSNIFNEDGSGASATATSSALPARTVKFGVRDNNGSIDLPYAGKFGFIYFGASTIQRFIVQTKIIELMIDLELYP